MPDIAIEAFREDVDNLAAALLKVVQQDVGTLPFVDRAIIVSAALANVACHVDAEESGPYVPECTGRLKRIAKSWDHD
jgi:hypothetical protein